MHKRSWKCKVGLHDFELIDYVESDAQLMRNIIAEEKGFPPPRVINENLLNTPLAKKVCLRCGKVVDTITPAIEKAKKELEAIQQRKNRAQKLFTESLKARPKG